MFRNYLPYYKRLLTLAIPLVLTQAGQMVVGLIDNAMVGRVGTTELAAASFANSIFMVVMVFGIGMYIGLTPLIGKALGAKDTNRVASFIKNGWLLSVLISILLFAITWALSYAMPYMNQAEEVWRLAISYYRILCVSLIPFLLFMFLKQIGEGLGNTLLAMIATIVSNVLNVVLNYAWIFGKLGFPELGLNGAGYATLVSRVVMAAVLVIAFVRVDKIRMYLRLLPGAKYALGEIKEVFSMGLPIATQLVVEVSIFAIGAVMMGWISDVALAAHQVALGLASFTFMIANGVAMATTIRVSFQHGKKDYPSLEKAAFSAVHLVLAYMLFCGIGFWTLRFYLPRAFSLDPLVIHQAASLLIVAAFFQLFDGLQVVCLGILRGIGDVKIPMIVATISYLIIGIPVSYVCAFVLDFGPEGIWYGIIVGLALAGVLLAFRIRNRLKVIESR